MLGSLLRPKRNKSRKVDRSPFSSPYTTIPHNTARPTQHADTRDENHPEGQPLLVRPDSVDPTSSYDEDEDNDRGPLLPIFSSAHLDELPLYQMTHAVRLLVTQKCETTLSWEQLRSPQVSQFLVKPIQSRIHSAHFNRATMSALLANCLQFGKEVETNPGNIGVSRTRAILCELLAMRLLKDFTARELIDALSYDFDPLQGINKVYDYVDTRGTRFSASHGVRVSAIEIAIRATAKRFLAHPLVVQQMQAVWAGSVVFHSAADNLHRNTGHQAKAANYGTVTPQTSDVRPVRQQQNVFVPSTNRRTVTLYDPRDASLFKLSRLRVPRYRQAFSTLSFSVMLGLYLAVLIDRSLSITPLEVVFWFWSIGFMLDELVGFTEQGFALYIISVWNAFDLGILFLFVVYYALRLYGVIMSDQRKHNVANMAYDVLASTAVLLFPRAFSVLDNYRYFSQLLIAFRMMAQDLAAVFGLITIICSGFFVAFTFAFFSAEQSGIDVFYALFQIVMGFTPAAWNIWGDFNVLGKAIMAIFLIICHFLIVTILITVLTNSFMAIVQNGNEEHQFLLAVNTISMVKSDALFSYVAPTNILAWLVSPLRYLMPFRQFVRFNRTIIKITHFPILLMIYFYERVLLSTRDGPTDFGGSSRPRMAPRFFSIERRDRSGRLREPSIVSYNKDLTLDEVFRHPLKDAEVAETAEHAEGDHAEDVVDTWMNGVGHEGGASPPLEQPQSVLDRLETRRPLLRRTTTQNARRPKRDFSTASRSVMSEPEGLRAEYFAVQHGSRAPRQETEADGDDELATNDEADASIGAKSQQRQSKNAIPQSDSSESSALRRGQSILDRPVSLSFAARARLLDAQGPRSNNVSRLRPLRREHVRQISNDTVVLSPRSSKVHDRGGQDTPSPSSKTLGKQLVVRGAPVRTRMQPTGLSSTGAINLLKLEKSQDQRRLTGTRREPSFNARALDLASDLGDDRFVPDRQDVASVSASFSERVFQDAERQRDAVRRREEDERNRLEQEEKSRVGRIMLARMNTLEEGFREMLREVKEIRQTGSSRGGTDADPSTPIGNVSFWSSDTRAKRNPKRLFKRSKGKEVEKALTSDHVLSPPMLRVPSDVRPALVSLDSGQAQGRQISDGAEPENKRSSVIFRGKMDAGAEGKDQETDDA